MFIWILLLRIDLKPVRNSSARLGHILARKDGALNVRCTLRMRFCAPYVSSFKTLFSILAYIMLSFGRIWISVGVLSTQPSIQWVKGTLSLGVKRPGREADHSPPSSAEFKNAWSYTSTPEYVFMAWCLVKHKDNFNLRNNIPYIKVRLSLEFWTGITMVLGIILFVFFLMFSPPTKYINM
jgi:hypothetical protein